MSKRDKTEQRILMAIAYGASKRALIGKFGARKVKSCLKKHKTLERYGWLELVPQKGGTMSAALKR